MSEKQDKETEKGEDPPREYRREASNDQVEITASDSMILTPASTSVDDIDDPQEITPSSDLSRTDRRICVVTTAALPWRTGTAVNPLLRALYLTRGRSKGDVTLLIPWLEDTKAQQQLYGQVFATENEQEEWIRTYCRDRCSCVEEERNLRVLFWKGSYHSGFGSIFPTEDIASLIPKEEADVAILEEPEHLNWWRIPPRKVETGEDAAELEWGWTDRFAHVVGVLHTNYGGYMKQYGLGTSFVTAPALNSLSALVVRAYCHRLVRLSGTLTSLDKDLEVTCNIHGVRDEFFQCPTESSNSDKKLAPVYFIGKIIWAKGFDKLLELQERYRESVGSYFPIDVYGGGDDVKAVKLAFFGRHNLDDADKEADSDSSKEEGDKAAASVFANETSLREVVQSSSAHERSEEDEENAKEEVGPGDVFVSLGRSGAGTAAETANAALKVIESVVETGIGAFSKKKDRNLKRPAKTAPFSLAPVRSRFKWRKTPLPARFLGVKDHIELRELPSQKIFLNMSTTEVLCTTSAEALAMGKFVILPKHPSNDFFYSFSNCLPYESLDECVRQLQYALENEPRPLDEETKRKLSWEGATKRLYKASAITVSEEAARKASNAEEERQRAVKFHMNSCRRSQFVTNLFSSNPIRKLSSQLSSMSDE